MNNITESGYALFSSIPWGVAQYIAEIQKRTAQRITRNKESLKLKGLRALIQHNKDKALSLAKEIDQIERLTQTTWNQWYPHSPYDFGIDCVKIVTNATFEQSDIAKATQSLALSQRLLNKLHHGLETRHQELKDILARRHQARKLLDQKHQEQARQKKASEEEPPRQKQEQRRQESFKTPHSNHKYKEAHSSQRLKQTETVLTDPVDFNRHQEQQTNQYLNPKATTFIPPSEKLPPRLTSP